MESGILAMIIIIAALFVTIFVLRMQLKKAFRGDNETFERTRYAYVRD